MEEILWQKGCCLYTIQAMSFSNGISIHGFKINCDVNLANIKGNVKLIDLRSMLVEEKEFLYGIDTNPFGINNLDIATIHI
jgi:hypothetical protein